MAGGSIGSGVNLDTYTSSGYYVQGSNSNTTSGTNWPTNNAGILTVVRAEGNTTHITQTYDAYNSNAFYNRSYYNGTWSSWRNLSQDTNTNTQLSDAQVRAKFSAGTNVAISSGGVISSTDTNTNTQLSTAQVRGKFSGTGINTSTGVITNTNTQLTDAQVRGKFSAGTNVAISAAGVISSTDTNTDTTYAIGDGGLTTKDFTATLKTKLDALDSSTYLKSNANDTFSGYILGSNIFRTADGNTNASLNPNGQITSVGTAANIIQIDAGNDRIRTFTGNATYIDLVWPTIASTSKTITFPDATGTIALTSNIPSGNQIIDWTTDQGSTNIHSGNYTNTNTTYSAGTGLTLTGTVFSNDIDNNNQLTNGAGYLVSTNDRNYITDSRGEQRAPSYYNDRYAQWDFQSSTDTTAGGDSWHALLTVSKWSSWNASHRQEQLLFTGDSLKRRTSTSDTAWGTVKTIYDSGNLTLSTLGYTGATNANYITNNNQLTNGAGYITSYTDTNTQLSDAQVRSKFTAGTNVAISSGGVISSTDTNTNTTYSAGRGLDISGTTFNLETDLRDSISYIGYDSNDYIQWSNNGWTRTVVNGTERLRVDTSGIDVSGRAKIDTNLTIGLTNIVGSSAVLTGGSANVNGGYLSTIAGGTLNLNCQYYGTIAGGYSNGLCTYYSGNGYSFIGAGACNVITSGLWSGIVSGCNNRIVTQGSIDSCQGNFIGSGNSNTIIANNRTSIVGGQSNSIYDQSDCSIIGGGYANIISHAETSIIGGGQINYISNGCHQTIGGGYANVISSPCNNTGDTISGGSGNHICNNNNSNNNTIAGGNNNRICTYYHGNNFIGGGTSNCIQSSYGAGNTILGGNNNRVYGGAYITIIGGSSINASSSNYVYVPNLCNVNGGTSDCRLKESICNIPYGLSHVSQLEPVSYKFTSDESKATKYGFLAQCVQEIMPDLITNHPTALVDGTPVLQFDKDAIWSSMVNAIKDLKNEVDTLKSRIDTLEA